MAEIAKTLDQGLELLRVVSDEGPGTVADLAERSGLNRTVVHRLVTTLERRRYVQRDDRGDVGLGPALIELGEQVRPNLRAAAAVPLKILAGAVHETAVLSIADGDEAVAIDQVEDLGHIIRVDYRPGLRHPLHRAAHGRAILAFRSETAPSDPGLVEIRRRGYALSHDELQAGAAGIASPIFDGQHNVIASIGIVAPVDRMPAERRAADAVVEAAAATSRQLGQTGLSRS